MADEAPAREPAPRYRPMPNPLVGRRTPRNLDIGGEARDMIRTNSAPAHDYAGTRTPTSRDQQQTFGLLNQLHGFRHRVCNSYSETLSLDLVFGNTEKMTEAIAAFKGNLDLFRGSFEAPADE